MRWGAGGGLPGGGGAWKDEEESACGHLGVPGRRQGPRGGLEAQRPSGRLGDPQCLRDMWPLSPLPLVCPQALSEPPALSSQIFLKVVEDCAMDAGPEGTPAGPCPDPSPRSRVQPDFRPGLHSWLT